MKHYPSKCSKCKAKLPKDARQWYCAKCEAKLKRERRLKVQPIAYRLPPKAEPEAVSILDEATTDWGKTYR